MRLQISGGLGTCVKSASWAEGKKTAAIGLDKDGMCNGFVKRLTDAEGNVYELRGTFKLAKNAKAGIGHSVTAPLVLVRQVQGEEGSRWTTQIEVAHEELTRVKSAALKAAEKDSKNSKKVARIEQSEAEADAFFGLAE